MICLSTRQEKAFYATLQRLLMCPEAVHLGQHLAKLGQCSTIATWFNPKGVSTAGPIDPISARTDISRPTVRA